jgi:hypothetical protein
MTFQPYPNRGGFISLGLTIMAAIAGVVLINLLPGQKDLARIFTITLGIMLILAVMGLTIYWAVIAFKLHYYLSRNGLAIRWGVAQQLIPFESIQQIVPGQTLAISPTFKGINLGGLRLGWGQLVEFGPLKFLTTAPPGESLFVVTSTQTYVISPNQPDQFIKAWQLRQALSPTQVWANEVRRSWPFNYPLLTDPVAWWFLAIAGVMCLALFGYFSFIFGQLPRSLPVHFNAFGIPDRIADKSFLFTLPTLGLLMFIINAGLGILIYRWEKVGAYLLWGSALLLQICLWVAAITLTA